MHRLLNLKVGPCGGPTSSVGTELVLGEGSSESCLAATWTWQHVGKGLSRDTPRYTSQIQRGSVSDLRCGAK